MLLVPALKVNGNDLDMKQKRRATSDVEYMFQETVATAKLTVNFRNTTFN